MPQISRLELFDLVWERPLARVATELGVAPPELKKACRRHHVPIPSDGYWAAVAAGGVFSKPILSPAQREDLETVEIVPTRPASAEVSQVTSKSDAPPARREEQAPPRAQTAPQQVNDPRSQPRRELAATAKAISKIRAKPGELVAISGRGVVPMTITAAVGERALAWLEHLLFEGEGSGTCLEETEKGARLALDGETVAFRIDEKQSRVPHVPTPKELAEKARRDGWGSYSSNPWPKYDYSPCGELSLVIDPDGYSPLRRKYADGKTQTLEKMTAEILAGFAAHAASIRERRLAAEESARRAAEAEARRRRTAAYQEREKRRYAFVDLIASKLAQRAKLVSVLAYAEQAGDAEMPPGMSAWLSRNIAEIDALLSPLFLEISARHAKIDFDEAAFAAKPSEPAWYYPREVSLELWELNETEGNATLQSSLEWALAQGLIPDVTQPPQGDE